MTISNYFIGRSVSNLDRKKPVGIPLGEIWNRWLQILADAFSLVSLGGESVKTVNRVRSGSGQHFSNRHKSSFQKLPNPYP